MKTTGIVFIVIGSLSTLGAIMGTMYGSTTSFGGVVFIVLGAFLVSRANKKKEERENKEKWEKGENIE